MTGRPSWRPQGERIDLQHEKSKSRDGSDKQHGIDAVENAAVSGDETSAVLPADFPFQKGFKEIAELSNNGSTKAQRGAVPGIGLQDHKKNCRCKRSRHRATDSARPRLVW